MNICVFCSSIDGLAGIYFDDAVNLGNKIAARGYTLVYGGTNRGLMGKLAGTVQKGGGRVIGVIPKSLLDSGSAGENLDELIIADNMRERKALMDVKADAFIFMPGGSGTLEEAMEAITLKQLKYHDRPLVFLNTNGFYNSLIYLFRKMEDEKFIRQDFFKLFHLADDVEDAFLYIDNYKKENAEGK
jgi:uncharacterized protein (TIGR00730 family)